MFIIKFFFFCLIRKKLILKYISLNHIILIDISNNLETQKTSEPKHVTFVTLIFIVRNPIFSE